MSVHHSLHKLPDASSLYSCKQKFIETYLFPAQIYEKKKLLIELLLYIIKSKLYFLSLTISCNNSITLSFSFNIRS